MGDSLISLAHLHVQCTTIGRHMWIGKLNRIHRRVLVIERHLAGGFLPASSWHIVGAIKHRSIPPLAIKHRGITSLGGAAARPGGGGGGGGGTPVSAPRGCNRVRVHHSSRRAAFSCFGGGYGGDVVGFVDLANTTNPRLISTCTTGKTTIRSTRGGDFLISPAHLRVRCTPHGAYVQLSGRNRSGRHPRVIARHLPGTVAYVTEQPTGMLIVGDALCVCSSPFVACES